MEQNNNETFDTLVESVKSDFDRDLEALTNQNASILQNRKDEIEKELKTIDGASNKANGGSGN